MSGGDGRAPFHALAVEWNRRLRDLWQADIRAALAKIDPFAPSGRLTAGALPPGTTRDTGAYNPAAGYRRGDIATGPDGLDYLALKDGAGHAPPDATYWRPLTTLSVRAQGGSPSVAARTLEFATGAIVTDLGGGAVRVAGVLDTEAIQDMLATFLHVGPGLTLTYDDAGNTLTIALGAPVVYLTDADGTYLVDGDGAFLVEYE